MLLTARVSVVCLSSVMLSGVQYNEKLLRGLLTTIQGTDRTGLNPGLIIFSLCSDSVLSQLSLSYLTRRTPG